VHAKPSRLFSVASTFVPFESFQNVTPATVRTRTVRCGRPRKPRKVSTADSGVTPSGSVAASAASAFSALWLPGTARSERFAMTRGPLPFTSATKSSSLSHTPRVGCDARENSNRRARGRIRATRGSSAFRTATCASRWFSKIRAFAAP
jgi:hypothetical protein